MYKEQGDFESALSYYYRALEIFKKEENSSCISVNDSIASVHTYILTPVVFEYSKDKCTLKKFGMM